MRLITLIFAFSLIQSFAIAQDKYDILHLPDGTKEVKVKEISQSGIKYTHPGEEVIYTINKFFVSKVEFESGRVEKFDSPLKSVNNILDAEDVYITFNPDEVLGLYNLGSLFSKATGVTTLSSINNVNNRALEKLKYEAAMMGANAVFIGNQYQRGNQYGNEYTPGNSTQTSYSGMAFSNEKLDLDEVEKLLKSRKFVPYQRITLKRNGWSPNIIGIPTMDVDGNANFITIDEIVRNEDGIAIKTKSIRSKTGLLTVIKFESDSIILMERDGKGVTNHYLLTEEHPFIAGKKP
ncbi:hypothetical protein [Algoriphagus formosus]|uniref:Uncharacterized protein n=1 Tax=Algoriphagus formosus TaxID=2007308 RepID=A0A4R5VEW2_9BACT|nr:hypothetical protein [Algoriphagus aquimaris]TDK50853.1 hypothetical protein E1898_00540 [Algoriphagus aquimaris]